MIEQMNKRTNLFLDMEFTGLHQNTTLISLALVDEKGHGFYAEFSDYDQNQVDDWLKENVLKHLFLCHGVRMKTMMIRQVYGTAAEVTQALIEWLERYESVQIWGDCLAWDWVLFCELFGGPFGLPKQVYYIPQEFCTLMLTKGVDPDISRVEFSGLNKTAHNALDDAEMIAACYKRLRAMSFVIETEADYEAAMTELLALMDVKAMSHEQDGRFTQLVDAIEKYEKLHYPKEA